MLNSKLDVEFAMAYEVILDDLKSGLKNDNTTQVPCSTASSSAAGKQKLSLPEEEDDVFLETIPMENNLETKDMWCCSSSTSSDQLCLVSKTWTETTRHRDSSCISVLPSLHRVKKDHCDIPNITHQMKTVQILDNNTPNHHNDFHVDFLNLKSAYFTNDLKSCAAEDSLVYIFLKSTAGIERVKVFLEEWRSSEALSLCSIELQTRFDKHRGLLTVYLNFPSPWITDTKWQLNLLAQFEDGRTMSCCSNTFNVRAQTTENRLLDIPLSHYQLHGRQPVIECSKTNCLTCPQHKLTTSCDGDDATIKLIPGTKLNYHHISHEVRKDDDIVYIEEQTDLPGLLKQEKRRPCKDRKCLKKTHATRPLSPETLSWVCGHCFFKRIKKSTVKSHVKQRVCLKRRRASAESQVKQQQRRRRGISRRSYTYPGIFF